MKPFILLLFLFCGALSPSRSTAQSNEFGMTLGPIFSNILVSDRNAQKITSEDELVEAGVNFNFGLTTALKNKWHLKSNIGFNFINANLSFEKGNEKFRGNYIREQVFFAAFLERRFLDDWAQYFVSFGIGYYHNVKSGFEFGVNRTTFQSVDLESYPN